VLTILSVAYPMARVGPDSVGGAEQVLATLDRALVAAGHRSIVIAPEGSTVAGELRPSAHPGDAIDVPAIYRCHASVRGWIARTLADEPVDVVHMHGVDFADYLPDGDVPVLATLHLWPSAYPPQLFTERRERLQLQCVSDAQRRACPPQTAAPVLVIRNGIDVDAFRPAAARGDEALVLGRVCREKGIHVAIDAAGAAGVPLAIAGAVFPYPAHREYFRSVVAPRLGGRVRFVGPLTGCVKRRTLAAARCLVVPSIVPETSSLVAMEALASGTPVVAFRTPALEELIEDGRTGWLVRTVDELADAMLRAPGLSSSACRAAAGTRCSLDAMTRQYVATYERLARARPATAAMSAFSRPVGSAALDRSPHA
jgi:glycosyltransferase involved in cell wall biosynthesis